MGNLLGMYASPEALGHAPNGKRIITAKTDMWSMGCLLLELLSDVKPFSHPDDQPDQIWNTAKHYQQAWVLLCSPWCCLARELVDVLSCCTCYTAACTLQDQVSLPTLLA